MDLVSVTSCPCRGYLNDLVLFPLSIVLAFRMVPASVGRMPEEGTGNHRRDASKRRGGDRDCLFVAGGEAYLNAILIGRA